MFQLSTIRDGGSHASTVAQCPRSPSAVISYSSPPSLGSNTTSLTRAPWIEWVARGHHVLASAVNTRKASSTAQSTVTVLRTASMTIVSFMSMLAFVRPLP
jgi:hypothetical protein